MGSDEDDLSGSCSDEEGDTVGSIANVKKARTSATTTSLKKKLLGTFILVISMHMSLHSFHFEHLLIISRNGVSG